jgi:hypothetical protein
MAVPVNGDISFPLAIVPPESLASICQVLWGWRPCTDWVFKGRTCGNRDCPCERAAVLEPFFDFYRLATTGYLPEDVGDPHPALTSHHDLLQIILVILRNPNTPRSQLTADHFGTQCPKGDKDLQASDRDRAFNLAARIISMVQPSAGQQFEGLLEAGIQPAVWCDNTSFTGFLTSVFPKRQQPALSCNPHAKVSPSTLLSSITSHRLKKVAGLDIIPTSDLREHLALDAKKGTVSVFHYTSVLKEHLSTQRQGHPNRDLQDSGPVAQMLVVCFC